VLNLGWHGCLGFSSPGVCPLGFLEEAARWSRFRGSVLGGVSGAGSLRGAVSAALREGRPGLILEYKRCRPGRFVEYRAPWEYVGLVGGAADAWSVLVEPFWFCGSPELVSWFAVVAGKPVLGKDFVTGVEQLRLLRRSGASAALLILDMVGWRGVERLYEEARGLGLEVLIETSGAGDALEAMGSFPGALVGINARDLRSLREDFEGMLAELRRAAAGKPSGGLLVAESSITSVERALAAARAGADALLIGTWAMREPEAVASLPGRLRGAREEAG